MTFTHYVSRVWAAVAHPPTPEHVRQRLLRDAQLDYLKAMAAAEDHHVQMEAHHQHAQMLTDRIKRLSGGAHV
jgi:hypothetical protein